MSSTIISTEVELKALCRRLRSVPAIGIDTEFISENSYKPALCLIQIATDEEAVIVDPLGVTDLQPFWEVLTDGDHETVFHAGREEIGFCIEAVGRCPKNMIDVQLAAGFAGVEYPAGYGTLTQRLVNRATPKDETLSDWKRRPLSKRQISYALDDVRFLLPMKEILRAQLDSLGRWPWFEEELRDWTEDFLRTRYRERWRNISGAGSLRGPAQMVLRELWRWRESEAQSRNQPPRRILRDDLLVELAKRQPVNLQTLASLRGVDRGAPRAIHQELVQCVVRGLASTEDVEAPSPRAPQPPQLNMLGQFLLSALGSICQDRKVAASLAGTASDVRELICYLLAGGEASSLEVPKLATGWRAELVGDFLSGLLAGKTMIRIRDPFSEQPLSFEQPSADAPPT